MMKYQQSNSVFVPKETQNEDVLQSSIFFETESILDENQKLSSIIKIMEDKISDLENNLKEKKQELSFLNDSIINLEKELYNSLGDNISKNSIETEETILSMDNIKNENIKLKEELNTQKEHAQLLYILIIALTIL